MSVVGELVQPATEIDQEVYAEYVASEFLASSALWRFNFGFFFASLCIKVFFFCIFYTPSTRAAFS